jgi:hypothetical protein
MPTGDFPQPERPAPAAMMIHTPMIFRMLSP